MSRRQKRTLSENKDYVQKYVKGKKVRRYFETNCIQVTCEMRVALQSTRP